jgi:hypothetical protein
MFYPVTAAFAALLGSIPSDMSPITGLRNGVSFVMERRLYGQTLLRLNATSKRTARAFSFSVGLVESTITGTPQLRVEFVKSFHPHIGSRGSWRNEFNAKSPIHLAAIEWACDTVIETVLANFEPSATPTVDRTHLLEKRISRRGCSYTNFKGTHIMRREHEATVYVTQ